MILYLFMRTQKILQTNLSAGLGNADWTVLRTPLITGVIQVEICGLEVCLKYFSSGKEGSLQEKQNAYKSFIVGFSFIL